MVCYKLPRGPTMRLLAAAIVLAVLPHTPVWAQAPGAPAAGAPVGEPPAGEVPPLIVPPSGQALVPPGEVSAGYYLLPSLRLTEEFDSNIFGTSSNRQWDFITRFSPGLSGGYRSEPFTLLVNGGFDAAIYPRHPDLNDATQGWHAGLDSIYRPTRPLALGLTVSYIETQTPSTLPVPVGLAPTVIAPATVLEFGLVRATFLNVSPSMAYQFTPLTWGTAAYSYIHDTIEDGLSTTANNIELRLFHRFSPRDTGVLGYRTTVIDNGGGFSTAVDYAPTVGWTHQFTPEIKASVEGGPLFANDGSVNPNVSARIEQQLKLGRIALGYSRSDGFVLGEPGLVKTETFAGSFDFEPFKSLAISVGPTITNLSGEQIRFTRIYDLIASASYPILRWLTARAMYRYGFEQVSGSGNIPRSIFSLSLEAAYPYRIE
jgi:hypothetical protein